MGFGELRRSWLGYVGQAFVDSLQSKVGNKPVGVYAVNYPATIEFPRAIDGINDAAVAGFVTADVVGKLGYPVPAAPPPQPAPVLPQEVPIVAPA